MYIHFLPFSHTPSTITPNAIWEDRNTMPFSVYGVCRCALLSFYFIFFIFIITKNIILIFTAHHTHLTANNDHTSVSLGDTDFISEHET